MPRAGFSWAPLMTARLCEPEWMTVEQAFQERLTTALAWHRDGDRLELRDAAGVMELAFARRVPADVTAADLIGRWEWAGDTAAPVRPWIAFDGERFVGHTGCRDFSGEYATEAVTRRPLWCTPTISSFTVSPTTARHQRLDSVATSLTMIWASKPRRASYGAGRASTRTL